MSPDPHLWITILAGGSGTRFWPVSTPRRPKQLLPLAGRQPLIRDTMERALGIVPSSRIRILTGNHLLEPFRGALEGLEPARFLVEPEAKGTGPVLTWAAWSLLQEDPEAVVVSLHADHAIEPWDKFQELIRSTGDLARTQSSLFTVAVPPDRPETGYGYIRPGEKLKVDGNVDAFRVDSFVEKPDRETAEIYLDAGYLWNSGIFLWRADLFLEEVKAVAPELGDLLPLLEAGDVGGFFRRAPNVSVDEVVLERSDRVASVRATFAWDDVGSWEALCRTCPGDRAGNVALGNVHLEEARRNIVMVEEGEAVLFGVEGLVVVKSGDILLVVDRERAGEIKDLLKSLPAHLRDPEVR
ncbi:MAG: mannose-1-phosphate guanylyltransferase [Longimicrobiales bacterium]